MLLPLFQLAVAVGNVCALEFTLAASPVIAAKFVVLLVFDTRSYDPPDTSPAVLPT